MTVEIELKLALPQASHRDLARHPALRAAGRPSHKNLVNLYFDTPTLDLHKRGIALRLRKQGSQWLQTVKCAGVATGGLSERPEWEQPCPDCRFDFSGIDDVKVRKTLERPQRAGQLVRVFETRFKRKTWRIGTPEGEALLLMADQGVVTSKRRNEPISEIEIELAGSAPGPMFALARKLANDLPLRPESLSKAERGYRLFLNKQPEPVRALGSTINRKRGPREAFRSVALACLTHLQANEEGAMNSSDPEFVHQMRVALRRLRSATRLFRPVLPPEFEVALAPRLSALTNALGPARDWDVTIDDVLAPAQRALADGPRLTALIDLAQSRRGQARRQAQQALASPDYGRLLLDIVAEVHCIKVETGDASDRDLRRLARKRVRKLRRRVAELAVAASTLEVPALHALRVGIKRLRYATEFFAPLYSAKKVKADLGEMVKLQEKLGLINDLAIAGRLLSAVVADDPTLSEGMAIVGVWYTPRFETARTAMAPRIAKLAARGRQLEGHEGVEIGTSQEGERLPVRKTASELRRLPPRNNSGA